MEEERGAILAFMLGFFQISLDECEEMYRKLGTDVFKQNVIVGTMKMGWSHAFYESEPWEKILKERMGEELLIQTARNPKSPKVAAISTIVNKGTPLKAFVFRNYNHLPSVRSHYMGGCQYKLWQAIRASSAAPGYFQEYAIGSNLHQLLLRNGCYGFNGVISEAQSSPIQYSLLTDFIVCSHVRNTCSPKGM
ncbi:hypothetical protein scyTo_0019036 [Scyliorhinus torazame]|uniref:PNPLA domain-containing protein n=1 Tax=Scyliorhinus torazame TaxID=75743 RepID=A0A401PRB0_SCYTO|nr:hypothetical protein [Scyliorhinus torazame]